MSPPQLTSSHNYPELQSNLIDQVCDQFESAMREGRQPRIEDFLSSFPNLDRPTLLQELIALEVELLGTWNESATVDAQHPEFSFASYYQRFPEATPALKRLQKEWELRCSQQSDLELNSISVGSQADVTDRLASPPRRRINQFELQSVLGHGAFGIVWHAKDKRLQRDVALKVRRPDRAAAADKSMFLREARAAARLHHPNIIAIHEVGELESEVYIVSELVDGVSLKAALETQPMSPTDAAKLMAKLATAVQHAHEQGIVHRDLKPANVLIDKKGEPHVADFGLAKRGMSEESPLTAGQLIGTPAYMSPEQARGDHKAIDARTDVYALGAIFYELLTQTRPFSGEMSVLLENIQNTTPAAPRSTKPDVPSELEAICLKCLSKAPEKRYATAKALAEDLHLYLAGETLVGIPAALPNRIGKWLRRHRNFVAAIALTFIVALTAAGSLAWQFRGTKPIPIEMREVEFTTEPSGCEITVVPLDPKSGEPDPTKIQHLKGRTPLTVQLEPADYLVVAVLDDNRFHEVYRHVPPRDETIPQANRHLTWRSGADGVIKLPSFKIPLSNVTQSMGFVKNSAALIEPKPNSIATPRIWLVPSFFVDPQEISVKDIEKWGTQEYGVAGWENAKRKYSGVQGLGPGPLSHLSYSSALYKLEDQGKRLPSAAELYYLSNVICAQSPTSIGSAEEPTTCRLPDQTQIEGLHSGVWEWTTTKIGGPFSGMMPLPEKNVTDFLIKMIGCGKPEKNHNLSNTGFRYLHAPLDKQAGARGVRSTKPRRAPKDFLTPIRISQSH